MHQDDRLDERVLDFLHALGDRQGGVERDHVVQVGREALLELGHERPGIGGGLHGVGIGQLVEGDQRGGLAIEAAQHVVVLRAQFNASDVPDAHDLARRARPGARSSPNSSAVCSRPCERTA